MCMSPCKRTRHFCQILLKLEFSRQISEKFSDIKSHENPSNGSRVFPCGRTDKWTDMMKLIVAFRDFENARSKKLPTLDSK
jgi:hypothetical protein